MSRGLATLGCILANAAVVAVVLTLLPQTTAAAGWFAYAPLADTIPARAAVPAWERAAVVVPLALLVLNLVLFATLRRPTRAAPRGGLRPQ